jgi:signal transduction histidine kinase
MFSSTKYRSTVQSIAIAVMAIVISLLSSHITQASTYGSGSYQSCGYNNSCPVVITPQPPMPNGLQVEINLKDGISIPNDGFDVTITQINSTTGSVTLKSATISIDGKQVAVVAADPTTHTVHWHWDPSENPGTKLTVVVTGSDDTTATYTYTTKPSTNQQPTNNSAGHTQTVTPTTNFGTNDVGGSAAPPPAIIAAAVPEAVKQVFRSLPPAVIISFPYFLFVLLAAAAIFLFLQIKRELTAASKAADAIEQERVIRELKKNFIGLASHYLRTPLTILSSGADLLVATKVSTAESIAPLKAAIDNLGAHVKAIIANEEAATVETAGSGEEPHTNFRIWMNVGIIVIVVLAAIFNFSAYASGRGAAVFNVVTQFVAFGVVALVLYQIERRFTLRRKERKTQDNILQLQQQLQNSQDIFLEETATWLYDDYNKIKDLARTLPEDDKTKPLRDGIQKLYGVVSKCRTAQSIKGSRSTAALSAVNLKDIFDTSDPTLAELINAKQLQLNAPNDKQVKLQEPSLVKHVARSLIDNAAAYSPENGNVQMSAADDGKSVTLAVADQGKGIPKDRQKMLFQPLSKIEGFENFDHEGMGLSLYLDKLIMNYLGGNIDLTSEENKGTTVNLQLPTSA